MKLTIRPDGEDPYDVDPTSRDMLLWERGGRGRSLSRLHSDPSVADLYALAHVTARRAGKIGMSVELAEFEASVDVESTVDTTDDGPDIAAHMAETLGLDSDAVLDALRQAWEDVPKARAADPTRTAR